MPRPIVCADYNQHMGGVDKSDQMLKYYEVLRKSMKYWKKLFLHFIDMAALNSYLFFQYLRKEYPNEEELKRKKTYGHKDFRMELALGLGRIQPDASVPLFDPGRPAPNPRHTAHVPGYVPQRKACVVCSVRRPGQRIRSRVVCLTCQVPLCLNDHRNCFEIYHSKAWDCHVPYGL